MLGYEVMPWCDILAPAGNPAATVTKWNSEVAHILQLPQMKERFVAPSIDLASNAPDEFGHSIKSEVPTWRKIIKDAGA